MKKNKIALLIISTSIMFGCSSTPNEEKSYDEMVETVETSGTGINTYDENMIITVSEEDFNNNIDYALTDGGYDQRVDELPKSETQEILGNNIIYFGFDSYKITNEMDEILQSQTYFLKTHPKMKVILEGHTDEKGSDSYNVVLGEKRANAVKQMMISNGVTQEQIAIISYGESKPQSYGTSKQDDEKKQKSGF